MRCSASPTTSTVRSAETAASASREAAAQFAAELTRVAFAPMAKSLGFYGDAALAAVSQAIARHETGGLTDAIERIMERDR